jgi:hypothetical protein
MRAKTAGYHLVKVDMFWFIEGPNGFLKTQAGNPLGSRAQPANATPVV